MILLAAVLGLLLQSPQEDVERLLERLSSDRITQRDEAARQLERLGLPALDRLQRELRQTNDLDLKLRLESLIERIPKIAELARVYGPTKRVTFKADGEPLGPILTRLGTELGEKVRSEGLDAGTKVSLSLEEATLWEALDRVSAAARVHYEYRKDGVVFLPGEAPALPVVYYEQFRISVAEVKRIDYRGPAQSDRSVLFVPEVLYQRNLSPAGDKYDGIFHLGAVSDAAGHSIQGSKPRWGGGTVARRRPFGLQQFYFLTVGEGRFSIEGRAKVNFAQENRELSIPLEGEKRELEIPEGSFRVTGLTSAANATTLTWEMKTPQIPRPDDRTKNVCLVDADGKRYERGVSRSTWGGETLREEITYPPIPQGAKRVVFTWVTGLHEVEIPFSLKGIPIP